MCNRVRANNGRILLINIEIDHLGGESHGNKDDLEMEKSRNWHWMWSKFYYNNKHYGFLIAILKISANFISGCLKFLYYLLIFNSHKEKIAKMRICGIYSSVLGKKSSFRLEN